MRQAHWKQPHEGVSGCMDDSKPHSHNTTVGLRVCRRYVLITDPPDDTKKQRRMLASDTYVRLHHQDFITTKRMCSIIGARRIARRGPHTARSGMDCSAARSTTPKTVLKLFINNNTKPAVVKKMGKWKNGKILFGEIGIRGPTLGESASKKASDLVTGHQKNGKMENRLVITPP